MKYIYIYISLTLLLGVEAWDVDCDSAGAVIESPGGFEEGFEGRGATPPSSSEPVDWSSGEGS